MSRDAVLTWADGYGRWLASVPKRDGQLEFASPEDEAVDAIKKQMLERGECDEDYEVKVERVRTWVTGALTFREVDTDG